MRGRDAASTASPTWGCVAVFHRRASTTRRCPHRSRPSSPRTAHASLQPGCSGCFRVRCVVQGHLQVVRLPRSPAGCSCSPRQNLFPRATRLSTRVCSHPARGVFPRDGVLAHPPVACQRHPPSADTHKHRVRQNRRPSPTPSPSTTRQHGCPRSFRLLSVPSVCCCSSRCLVFFIPSLVVCLCSFCPFDTSVARGVLS